MGEPEPGRVDRGRAIDFVSVWLLQNAKRAKCSDAPGRRMVHTTHLHVVRGQTGHARTIGLLPVSHHGVALLPCGCTSCNTLPACEIHTDITTSYSPWQHGKPPSALPYATRACFGVRKRRYTRGFFLHPARDKTPTSRPGCGLCGRRELPWHGGTAQHASSAHTLHLWT